MSRIDISFLKDMADSLRRPFHENYLSMYSSVFGGITTDPVMMMVPVDDHLVHRGDGVFEVFKCVNGSIYNLKAHLDRLKHSAETLGFNADIVSDPKTQEIVKETIRAGKKENCLIKFIISRGPGSLGVNPYDCPKNELYIMVTTLAESFMSLHPNGAKMITSSITAKIPFFATVKSCNYLINVLMQKEASEEGVDFVAAFDKDGRMAEGATENIGMISNRELVFPCVAGTLTGTTMLRVMDLAGELIKKGVLEKAEYRDITREDLGKADEIIVTGTTRDVVSVVEFDRKPVGKGVPGSICVELNKLLARDIMCNKSLLTPVF